MLPDRWGVCDMSPDRRLWKSCEDWLAGMGLELDDLEVAGQGRRLVRITVDGAGGVDVQQLADASRVISRRLDELDPFEGSYSLEVTSPGLERNLRRPLHFRKSIGRDVTVRTSMEVDGFRHHQGILESVEDEGFVISVHGEARRIAFRQVRNARTRFEWKKRPASGKKSG